VLGVPLASAQPKDWPTRPIRLVVAFPAGGLADVLIRLLQAPLGEALGQAVIVDNRGGASGNVAAAEVVSNGRDGHTLLVTASATESVNPVMYARMPF
jgi:tripartite-type tricarboxylate transporter receptor subunit TctC